MLELRPVARVSAQASVLPQVVARASLLELSQDGLEERVQEELERNPSLELVEPPVMPRYDGFRRGPGVGDDPLARVPSPTPLRDDLLWQVRMACEGERRRLAEHIIESLDHRGYLTTPVFELAEELCVCEAEIEDALAVVHELEPRGIGARGLAECLKLQVLAMRPGEAPPGLVEFLEDEFAHVVCEGDARSLRSPRTPGAGVYLTFIRDNLYPYPADLYRPPYPDASNGLPAHPPDAVIERDAERLRVTVPLSQRLMLRVDAAYENLARSLESRSRDEQARSIKELVGEAREFISNLTHRHTVIARVAAGVIEEQDGFISHGPSALKPLTKKELARKLDLHESTVCRATRGKSIMLPDGEVVPFGVFFEEALPTKVALAQLVHQEDPTQPLTDSELVERLREHGYVVARRTVTKYRACLDIQSASERRVRA